MSNNNRSRITVDIPGSPALYQSNNLPGWEIIGVVHRGENDIGALAKNLNTGIYCQANNGAIRSIDQRKIKAALGIGNNAGRPDIGVKPHTVTLTDDEWVALKKAGGGNASDGIRILLQKNK